MDGDRQAATTIDVETLVDAAPLNRFLITVVGLCAGVAFLDGFDTLAISYVAPVIAKSWHLPPASFGPVFAAHYLGAALGAVLFGMLADRVGRKPAILASTALFGVFSLFTAVTQDFAALFLARTMTGIGLGGALSNVISLVSEFAPARFRATMVSLMYAAFPVGGVLGGPLSNYVMTHFGWQAVFFIGGMAPLLLLLALGFVLPESVRFLVSHGAKPERVARQLARMLNQPVVYEGFTITETQHGRLPISEVFRKPLARPTIMLWLASFLTQLVIVYVITWMPTLLSSAGLPLARAIQASATFSIGGIIGSILLARVIDRQKSWNPLVATYVLATLAIGAIGYATAIPDSLLAVVCLAGITIVGAQVNLSAYAATVYPTRVRATGLGWTIGMGRVGAILGAMLGTLFTKLDVALDIQYLVAAVPSLVAAAAVKYSRV
jgi:AAHS family 4-hydroxybenzoate transporter-like MFS transporter